MRIALQIGFVFLLFFSVYAYAEDSSKIEMQKVGGRTEATVPNTEPTREKPAGFFRKSCYIFETGILKTARCSSSMVGKITDSTVWGVQKTSDVLLSPIVKTLDIRRWFHKKQTSFRENV